MTATDVSQELKPLVAVISPARRTWFSHNEMASNSFGAGVLLEARPEGYLWLTARHVIGEGLTHRRGDRALVAMTSGAWAGADVVGRHKNLDLCLLWLPREPGSVSFLQPEPSPNGASVSEAPGSAEDPWSQKISIS